MAHLRFASEIQVDDKISHSSIQNLLPSRRMLDDPDPIDGIATAMSTKLQRSITTIPEAAGYRSYQRRPLYGGCQERASLTAFLTKQVAASTK
jgi:hypothetical protein